MRGIRNPLARYDPNNLEVTIASYVGTIMSLALTAGGVLILYFFIAGAIRWMTAAGDKIGIETAKKMLTNAMIGLLLLIAVVPVVKFIGDYFGVDFFNVSFGFIR